MPGTPYFCCDDDRRAALQNQPELNGIDFLEVDDLVRDELDAEEQAEYEALPVNARRRLLWQRRLTVHFVNPLRPEHLAALLAAKLRVEGGTRADRRDLGVSVIANGSGTIVLRASARGDFSTYRLRIVTSDEHADPPPGFDPQFAQVDFSFKVECPSDFDCADACACPPVRRPPVGLDYLARDYGSYRRFILDRITALVPSWRERHAADLGVALVELVAYVADHLSYRQDAVATEAYLGTARRRISVRRHARLVDYPMHDGCNARVWVQVLLDENVPPGGITLERVDPVSGETTKFITRCSTASVLDPEAGHAVLENQQPEVFEPLFARRGDEQAPGECRLHRDLEELPFYTWGGRECCLPKGATHATLLGRIERLGPGDVLLFEEIRGARTGEPGDADPQHRHVVRLTRVAFGEDPLGGQLIDSGRRDPVEVTEIQWGTADALTSPFCISAIVPVDDRVEPIVVGVARGNIVLADHGRSVRERLPEPVPAARLFRAAPAGCGCASHEREPIPTRFTPTLGRRPLTQAPPYDPARSAREALAWRVGDSRPQVRLESDAQSWRVRRDLFGSDPGDSDFVAEMESDGTVQLRFGDGRHGERPAPGTAFIAHYRVGNGRRGNVGAGAIQHVITRTAGIRGVRNPLPATGGMDPESIEDVRRFAPVAFLSQERAVTPDDYARMTERHGEVQKAVARFRWTGSWRTVFVTVDPRNGAEPEAGFSPALPAHLEPYRLAGHDVEIDRPRHVPLEIEMQVCAKREYFRADVKKALHDVFSKRVQPDGRTGVFHPDRFSFGQPVYLSRLYAAAYEVDGVESVVISKFRRLGSRDTRALDEGKLEFRTLEIAQLESDRNFPDRGVFRLRVDGGK